MKDSTQPKRTLGPDVSVQTVRLLPQERAHLESLQKAAELTQRRKVSFNEIMVKGLMNLGLRPRRRVRRAGRLKRAAARVSRA